MTITEHQQHMADLDKGIKAAEAGIARHLEQRKATKHVISTCDTHTHIYLGLPECPVCVREERDRLRIIVRGLEDETADKVMWREEARRYSNALEEIKSCLDRGFNFEAYKETAKALEGK